MPVSVLKGGGGGYTELAHCVAAKAEAGRSSMSGVEHLCEALQEQSPQPHEANASIVAQFIKDAQELSNQSRSKRPGHCASFRMSIKIKFSEMPRRLLLSLGVPSRPSSGSGPGPVQVPSRVQRGPVQIRHVFCFPAFRAHPDAEVGAIPARPGPILLPSVPSTIGPGRAETDFSATSDQCFLGAVEDFPRFGFFTWAI